MECRGDLELVGYVGRVGILGFIQRVQTIGECMMREIERMARTGYVITLGVYVKKTVFILSDNQAEAEEVARDELNLAGATWEAADVEVLSSDPEYDYV
jgi:hypothetical protein